MLQLKNIRKIYKVGDSEVKALDDVSVSFRDNEFVAIVGTSGSGKSTCLNIIGGLDSYTDGDLILDGKSTKKFTDSDWDAYRNNSIGFIFQSYNLISHLSLLENVEMGLTLSGVSSKEKRAKAVQSLKDVGLTEYLNKRPNQLSGGQMQRVAIARALANDPEILLCDEPTGALDSVTSIQIMNLIHKVAKEKKKLVIMVTHSDDLADKYADRIVRFKDGRIISDSSPYTTDSQYDKDEHKKGFTLKKTCMKLNTALKLSLNNIKTKKGRTALTALASSIGIIGIATILSLSVGFQTKINDFQSDSLSELPIIISQESANVDIARTEQRRMLGLSEKDDLEYSDAQEVYSYNPEDESVIHKNIFTDKYIDYINNIDPAYVQSIGFTRILGFNLLGRKDDGTVFPIPSIELKLVSYPKTLNPDLPSYIEENYDLLKGRYPEDKTDLVLVVDSKNRVDKKILNALGFESGTIDFDSIIGKTFKIASNNEYYTTTIVGTYMLNTDYDEIYNSENNIDVTIKGIIRPKEDKTFTVLRNGLAYSDELASDIIEKAKDSEIVITQKESDYSILTMEQIDEATKKQIIQYLGGDSTPYLITIYPVTFDTKDAVTKYLDEYNKGLPSKDTIVYTDLASNLSQMTDGIMSGITYVLIAFAGISLVVSTIMVGIVTYISVLERTREIGILKALGARKKDITRVFNAETLILGGLSGALGIIISYLAQIPINKILYNKSGLEDVARLPISYAVLLIILSTVLTLIGGAIPAKMAAKKDAVEALRAD
ncbi:MAG: ATP-binding cassette domain-containing protein [Clostridium sp.]|nr:ATP-binding cassette domain-containing protein [Clostridium sp.]